LTVGSDDSCNNCNSITVSIQPSTTTTTTTTTSIDMVEENPKDKPSSSITGSCSSIGNSEIEQHHLTNDRGGGDNVNHAPVGLIDDEEESRSNVTMENLNHPDSNTDVFEESTESLIETGTTSNITHEKTRQISVSKDARSANVNHQDQNTTITTTQCNNTNRFDPVLSMTMDRSEIDEDDI
jgi:hypothetical protein